MSFRSSAASGINQRLGKGSALDNATSSSSTTGTAVESTTVHKRKRSLLASELEEQFQGRRLLKKSRLTVDAERRLMRQREEESDTGFGDALDDRVDDMDLDRMLPPRILQKSNSLSIGTGLEEDSDGDDEDRNDLEEEEGFLDGISVSNAVNRPLRLENESQLEQNRQRIGVSIELTDDQLMQQKHEIFDSAIKKVGLAPPRLESINGDKMVRPLDTHVQQTNAQAMGAVISTFKWPVLNEKDSKIECFWTLRFLENAFGILDHSREKQQAQSRALLQRLNEDNPEDAVFDEETEDEDFDLPADFRRRGPGNKRNYKFFYTEDELMRLDSIQIVYDRLGLNRDEEREKLPSISGNVFNLETIETYIAGMHSYVLMLKKIMTNHVALFPYQIEQQKHIDIQRMYQAVNADPELGETEEEFVPRDINQRLQRVHEKISNVRVALRALNEIGSSCSRPHGLPTDLIAYGLVDNATNLQVVSDSKKSSARHDILSLLMQECLINQYKRCGDYLYQQIKSGGFGTQAYSPLMTINQFCWRLPDPVAEKQKFGERMSEVSLPRFLEENLKSMHEHSYLPDLVRCRYQWSFQNGIYTGNNNRFWKFGCTYPSDADCPFTTGSISARYFNEVFDEMLIDMPIVDIQVDSVEQIMNTQKWSEGVKSWLWVSCGRCLYDVGHFDNWQFTPYLKGLAGTGKSSICEMLAALYDSSMVGTLSNDMEDTFGLMTHYKKDLLVAPELRGNFRLSQARFQTMTSGEMMGIPRKNSVEVELPWRSPMFMAGNAFPEWHNTGGAIGRRILPFMMDEPVPERSTMPDLKKRIKNDLQRILVKANRYYLLAAEVYGDKNIWECLPAEFLKYRSSMQQDTSNVTRFLQFCSIEQNDVEQYTTLSSFIEAMKVYGNTRNWKHKEINDMDVWRTIKQALATNSGEGKSLLRLHIQSESGKPKEHRIYGLRLPETVDSSMSFYNPNNAMASNAPSFPHNNNNSNNNNNDGLFEADEHVK